MRRPGFADGARVAHVIADCMLHEVNPVTCIDDAHAVVASVALRDALQTPRRLASVNERRSKAHHESGHAMAALAGGATQVNMHLRVDSTGQCNVDGIEVGEPLITFLLAGAFAEIKFRPSAIHDCTHPPSSDFLMARGKIDALNASRTWPQLTYRTAAKNAMRFVEAHWLQIRNLALALDDAGELDDGSIRIFAKCK